MTAIFQEQSCTYLVENLFLKPTGTAKLCASLADNSSTFGIVGLWALHGSPNIFHRPSMAVRTFFTGAWLDLGHLLVLADSWPV